MEAQTTTQNKPIVTKDWLANKIKEDPNKIIGRALAAIYVRQTGFEQSITGTVEANGVGFSKPDARIGSIGARMYHSHGALQAWVVKIWSTPAKDGYPRICKYANQLQQIADEKRERLRRDKPLNIILL